ncbi:MAG TPA: hypothetical protein DEF42_02805 [Desulfosporosinus sp.]|nr:hypothetical protein [Desulfosporosinus sp.]
MECGEKGLWSEFASETPTWGDHRGLNALLVKIANRDGLGDIQAAIHSLESCKWGLLYGRIRGFGT